MADPIHAESMSAIEKAFHSLQHYTLFEFQLFGQEIVIRNTIFVSWVAMLMIVAFSVVLTKKLSVNRPGKLQCIAEIFVDMVNGLCKSSIGHHYKPFVAYIGSLLMFLAVSNMIAIFNFIPGLHLYPPAKDITVTGTLAIISICVVIFAGFKYKGVKGWLKGLADPMPLMIPFKLLEYFTKPLSLCLRLFGNVLAAFIIMKLILNIVPYLGAPFAMFFDMFDGILQAFIFIYLTSIYIGEAVE
ncbi:MAG: F0F1 ATP synthase subunit A [Defluviitaleaceae bacterium]|nr:F0F1 ATP synthase subunit A [Defluviitaleaceae bacterium]